MRLDQLLFQSLREDPAGPHSDADRLLIRAGFVRHVRPGGRVLLPLGARALRRLDDLVRAGLEDLGCREVALPGPESGAGASGDAARSGLPSAALARELFGSVVRSHRQLPSRVFAVRAVSGDNGEASARGRNRLVVDVLLADCDLEALAATLAGMESRVRSVLGGLELPASPAEWAAGAVRAAALAWVVDGDEMLVCAGCGYAADRRIAGRRAIEPEGEEAGPLEEVATPGATTIASLAEFLGVGAERCLKAAFYTLDDGRLITAIVRGDNEVSEVKLALATGASHFAAATDDAIRWAGMEPGYGSPVGAAPGSVIADPLAVASPNLVAGANRQGFHLRNVNGGRDYVPDVVADIARAVPGDGCPRCPGALDAAQGMALAMWSPVVAPGGPTYADVTGARREIAVAVARIEVERMLAAVVATHHDDRGIVWPRAAAPFPVHVVVLSADRDPEVAATAERLAARLSLGGCCPLWDARDESPGVKFADADLVGVPLRITVSPRSVAAAGVEVTYRGSGEHSVVSVDEAARLAGAEHRGP